MLFVAAMAELAKRSRRKIGTSVGSLLGVVVLAAAAGAGGSNLLSWTTASNSPAYPIANPRADTDNAIDDNAFTPNTGDHDGTDPPPTAVPCTKPLTITSPANGTAIVGHVASRSVSRPAASHPGETGWLFDLDPNDGTYGRDGDGPIVTGNGTTTFDDTPVGDSSDANKGVKLVAVLVNPTCATALATMNLDNNYPTTLPRVGDHGEPGRGD